MEDGHNVEIPMVPQIENWFLVDEWELTEEKENIRWQMYPFKFFDTYVAEFWSYLTLMEVINLAITIKNAAYVAYSNNERGFRDFCNLAWNERKLDLSEFEELTIKSLNTLDGYFYISEILFPANVPEEILDHLPYARTFTFNLKWRRSYKIPKYAAVGMVNLTINGSFCVTMNDSLNAILFAFPRTNNLTINNAYFTEVSVAALGTTKLIKLNIIGSSLAPGNEESFVRAMLNSKDSLESIRIDCANNYNWEGTIKAFSKKIGAFKNLRECHLTLNIGRRNIQSMRALSASKSLTRVHVITNCHFNMETYEEMVEVAKTFLGMKNISMTTEERMMFNQRDPASNGERV